MITKKIIQNQGATGTKQDMRTEITDTDMNTIIDIITEENTEII